MMVSGVNSVLEVATSVDTVELPDPSTETEIQTYSESCAGAVSESKV